MQFPEYRARRMRRNESLRRLVRETRLSTDSLIQPLFAVPGKGVKQEISSLPGQHHLSVDKLGEAAKELRDLGIPGVLLFGIPEKKDAVGSEAWDDRGIVQRAIREIRRAAPELAIFADACFCEYTTHGHCGVVIDGELDNDASLDNLARTALSYAKAGVDLVAPSGMLDGFVGFTREALDEEGHDEVGILAYSAKYASAFYGPFREAVGSSPHQGDRKGYQLEPTNVAEAIREVSMDVAEGADIIMVKPALAYLDVIARVRDEIDLPLAAYNVSGEYAMLEAAAEKGWIDRDRAVLETLLSIRRAGAEIIITYHARHAARLLQRG